MTQEKDKKQEETKPAALDACVNGLIEQGVSEDNAWAICTAAQKNELYIADVKGYAAVFGNVDKDFDVVQKGAFSNWLKVNKDEQLPLLWVHKYNDLPLGVTTLIKEDDYGLYYEAKILNTEFGHDLIKGIKAGAVTTASYRYKIHDKEIADSGIRFIKDMEISEISAVTKGMSANPLATIELVGEKTEKPVAEKDSPTDEINEAFQAGLRQFINQIGG